MAGEHETETEATLGGTLIAILVAPVLLESLAEAAVTVAYPDAGTLTGAVYKPAEVMDPKSTPHVTLVLKEPVPVTAAVHWLVCPVLRAFGAQAGVTDVTDAAGPFGPVDVPLHPARYPAEIQIEMVETKAR